VFADFMINAWIVGTLVAAGAGLVGFFVVLRGSAFPAHAIPNGAFAGAAGASMIGIPVLWGITGASLGVAFFIGAFSRRIRSDVATTLALVTMLAVGAAMLSVSSQYQSSMISLLFGQILGVSRSRIVPAVAVLAGSALAIGVMYRPLLLSSLAPDLAQSRRVRLTLIDSVFLVVLALTSALCVPLVGALLSFALMIGPPAAARSVAARPGTALALSVIFSIATLWASIASSYLVNWPVGFFVGTYGATLFVVARLGVRLWPTAKTS
jgi:zinc/manganese transport system permease protein